VCIETGFINQVAERYLCPSFSAIFFLREIFIDNRQEILYNIPTVCKTKLYKGTPMEKKLLMAKVTPELHKRVKIRAAELGLTVTKYLTDLIENDSPPGEEYVYPTGYRVGDPIKVVKTTGRKYCRHINLDMGQTGTVLEPPNPHTWPADAVQVRILGGEGALDADAIDYAYPQLAEERRGK